MMEIRALLQAIEADATLLTTITTERNTLAAELATDPAAGREITTGSANGSTFTADITMTKRERLVFLQRVIDWQASGLNPTNYQRALFL